MKILKLNQYTKPFGIMTDKEIREMIESLAEKGGFPPHKHDRLELRKMAIDFAMICIRAYNLESK